MILIILDIYLNLLTFIKKVFLIINILIYKNLYFCEISFAIINNYYIKYYYVKYELEI